MRQESWQYEAGPGKWSPHQLIVQQASGYPCEPFTLGNLDRCRGEVRGRILERWERWKDRVKPGRKYRLLRSEESGGILRLGVGLTDYGIFVATNREAMDDPEYAAFLRAAGRRLYGDEHALFASPSATAASSEQATGRSSSARDQRRPRSTRTIRPARGPPGTFPSRGNGEGQFAAMRDELEEETGIVEADLLSLHIIGIARNRDNHFKPNALFLAEVAASEAAIRQRRRDDKFASLDVLGDEDLRAKLRDGSFIPPAEAALTAYFAVRPSQP